MNSLLIECSICKSILDEPVLLPCGHTICKKHETAITISCFECNLVHEIPKNVGFPPNLIAKTLVKRKFDRLDLGPEHNAAVESTMYIQELFNEFVGICKNTELVIAEAIGKLRLKLDLYREEAKKKIDDNAIALIEELDEYEVRCKDGLSPAKIAVLKNVKELLEVLNIDMAVWLEEVHSFEKNVKRLKTVHQETISGYKKLSEEYEKIKKNLFTDEFEKFVKKQKLFCGEKTDPLILISLDLKIDEIGRQKFSKRIERYGVGWYTSGHSLIDEEDDEEYLKVYLHADHDFENKLQVNAKLEIINEIFPQKSITGDKEVDLFEFSKHSDGESFPTITKLSDLKATPMYLDQNSKIINCRVSIFDLKWI